jgi:ATP:cob(I)alamin adenosyltransferase
MSELLVSIQRDLYDLMAEVGATPENAARFRKIDDAQVTWLETKTDQLGDQVVLPREFILPGDTPGGAALSVARTVVRRAERRMARLLHNQQIENPHLLRYLNRLSSLCFVLELWRTSPAVGQPHPSKNDRDHPQYRSSHRRGDRLLAGADCRSASARPSSPGWACLPWLPLPSFPGLAASWGMLRTKTACAAWVPG